MAEFDVEAFCIDNSLDEQATTALKELDEEMQREILGRGPLTDARNPSAVLLSRIRQLKSGGGGGRSKGGGGGFGGRRDRSALDGEVEAFIRDNELDDRASACLRESDADILTELFARGPLTGARNASAMLLSRVKAIKEDLANGRGGKGRRDGGYGGGNGGKGKGRGGKSYGGGGQDLRREVENFIKENDLDSRASDCLRESDDDLLTELFARGPLTGARNPSAMVLSRIRAIKDDLASGKVGKSSGRGDGGYGRDDKGKGKGKGDDWWSWFMPPPWMMWGGKGDWDSWGKGAWDSWGKGDGGKGKGEDGGKGRAAPY